MQSAALGRSAIGEIADGAEARLRLLNIRHVAAVIQYAKLYPEPRDDGPRRLKGDQVVSFVYDEGRTMDVAERVARTPPATESAHALAARYPRLPSVTFSVTSAPARCTTISTTSPGLCAPSASV